MVQPPSQVRLTSQQLDEVLQILETHLPTTVVYAFGSRATGHAKPHSDLDCARTSLGEEDVM
jgi:predicted nucleotidyltransferase